jgi:TonB family protein
MIALLALTLLLVQQAPTQTTPKPVMTAPKVKFAPEPEVSKSSLRQNYQINVLVALTIDVNGKPQGTHILRPSGDACVDQIALAATTQYRFTPARADGVVTPVEMHVQVNVRKF